MARWAGVQKVSRPMERCQETSHAPPMVAEVMARAPHQTYQGTEVGLATALVEVRVRSVAGTLSKEGTGGRGWVELDMKILLMDPQTVYNAGLAPGWSDREG